METPVSLSPCADDLLCNLTLINTAMWPCRLNMLIKLCVSFSPKTNPWRTPHLQPTETLHLITSHTGLISGERPHYLRPHYLGRERMRDRGIDLSEWAHILM